MMIFLLLMVAGTFFLGAQDVFQRKYLRDGINQQFLLGIAWIAGGAMLLPALFYYGTPKIMPGFWSALLVTAALNVISQSVFIRAFALSEASLIAPLRLLTPPLVILTGFFILGEAPTFAGAAGIVITMAGLWLLLSSENNFVFRGAFTKVFTDQGILWGIIGATLFAFSLPFDKKAVVASSALFFSVLVHMIVGLAVVSGSVAFSKNFRGGFWQNLHLWRGKLLLIGLFIALGGFMTNQALNYSLVAYAASLKRLWSFWTIVLAGSILQERRAGRRFLATAVMFSGIIITVVWG